MKVECAKCGGWRWKYSADGMEQIPCQHCNQTGFCECAPCVKTREESKKRTDEQRQLMGGW